MKLEKEVYFGNTYYTERFDKKYHLNFNCIVCDCLNEKEKEIFSKLQTKTKIKLTLEVVDPILDEEERKYLSGVIRPFRDKVFYIKKQKLFSNTCYIEILIESSTGADSEKIDLPSFWKEKMYKGMELDKEYTLEELGL